MKGGCHVTHCGGRVVVDEGSVSCGGGGVGEEGSVVEEEGSVPCGRREVVNE